MDDRVKPVSRKHWWSRLSTNQLRVCLALLLVCSAVVLFKVVQRPGVYFSDAQVRFVAPTNASQANTLQISNASLIATAGAVGQMVDDRDTPRPSSPDATISGMGVRDGWAVTLPNSGGQWADNYADPFLDVQVVGPTPQKVQATMARIVAKIEVALVKIQNDGNAPAAGRITAKVLPLAAIPVYYQHGSRMRAAAGAFGVLVGIAALGLALIARQSRKKRIKPVPTRPVAVV
jgi:hypothetical protein